MSHLYKLLILPALLSCFNYARSQRSYTATSVLATGNWYKIAVSKEGVYKMDVAFLNSLGITGSIVSSQVRLYGNGGRMVPESNAGPRPDDLLENAIWVEDGGDGILNGTDFIAFFASGPDQWIRDSVARRFSHKKNLYSDHAFYYITIGGSGKRISTQAPGPAPQGTVTSFDERYFHELDSVNFLSSGKEWYGEEFSNLPGRTLSRTFNLPLTDLLPGTATIEAHVAARSINQPARFTTFINGQAVQQIDIPSIGTGQFDVFARSVQRSDQLNLLQSPASLSFSYSGGSFNSQGWLNWFEFFCRRKLVFAPGAQLLFRDWNSVGQATVQYQVANAEGNAQVWEVSDPLNPVKMSTSLAANVLSFNNDAKRLREYVGFSGSFLIPAMMGKVFNQNLHASAPADYLVIAAPAFLSEAERVANFHRQRSNLKVTVVTTEQVYNEFSGGNPDPSGIRDFVKMYYDRYRSNWSMSGKYLLLFGKGSFDYKNRISGNTSLVPVYETVNSLDPLATYTSDDFFGFLDDNEDINTSVLVNQLDIGIGRLPATTAEEAKNFVDKLYDYHSPDAFGPWRNNLDFVADDEDFNLHLQDAETLTAAVAANAPVFNPVKIYLDAYQQESGSSGGRYPQANAAVNSHIYNGALIWNYSGHGGPDRLAEEVVLDQSIVNNWTNRYRLPLFITATCDFAPYDNPLVFSLGENLILRPKTGAIALMTTTRVVFAYSNRIMNNNYLQIALKPDSSGRYKTLGEAVKDAKNYTYQTSGDISNNRKFSLLGDPAMTLAFPALKAVITNLNGRSNNVADTLSAMESVNMEGEVRNQAAVVQADFNGTVFVTVFDKPRTVTTLANDAGSLPVAFSDQSSVLFRGKATVKDGRFNLSFKMPRDINYQYGRGKISLYAHDGKRDGNGFSANVIIGGISTGASGDNEGPVIRAYLNDESFINGGLANANPVLILHLADSSGINTGSSGIDHDIVVTIDDDSKNYYILNNFYESDIDNYQRGMVHFQLPSLKPGRHSLKIKAWDVLNNSTEYLLEFTVAGDEQLRLEHVLNYPNPFTTKTNFWFEHNAPGTDLSVKVEIFTISGKLIKTIAETINRPGNRSSEIDWNGVDEYGNKAGRGLYLYRVRVRTADGRSAEKWGKLVLLG